MSLGNHVTTLIVEAALDAVVIIDGAGAVRGWNRQAETMFGWPKAAAMGRSLSELIIPPRYRAAHDRKVATAGSTLEGSMPGKWVELTAVHADGREFPVEAGLCVLSVEGDPLIAAFLRDITDRKSARTRDERLRRDLERFSELSTTLNRAAGLKALAEVTPSLFTGLSRKGALFGWANQPAADARLVELRRWGEIADSELEPVSAAEMGVDARDAPGLVWGDRVSGLVLAVGEDVQGILCLGNEAWRSLAETGVYSRATIAHELAVALQKANLHDEIRAGQQSLEQLSRRVISIQECERGRVARELHDELGQLMTGLNFRLELAGASPDPSTQEHLSKARALVGELLSRVRNLSLDLRPGILDDLGLVPALRWLLGRHDGFELAARVSLEHSQQAEQRFNPDVETAAYRVAQEAVTNASRHAAASVVKVRVWTRSDALCLQVEDNGRGFDVVGPGQGAGSGLLGMGERTRQLGGRFSLESAPGHGTLVMVELPIGASHGPAGGPEGRA